MEKSRPSLNLLMVASLFLLRTSVKAAAGDEHWDHQFGPPGTDNSVYMVEADDTDVYVGGIFGTVGGSVVNRFGRFDGLRWSSLGSGVGDFAVWTSVTSGSNVYVGGDFTSAGGLSATNVARWNGTQWSALGTGINGLVYALAVVGKDLYAGGAFTIAGGVAVSNIARWDGTNWHPLGSGITGLSNVLVKTFATDGTNLYVGGIFTHGGGVAAMNVARWNGSSWSALAGGGIGDPGSGVLDLLLADGCLYAGGGFRTAGAVAATNIAKWDGANWSALGNGIYGIPSSVYQLAKFQGDLYACGQFTLAGNLSANGVARWNGSSWTNLGAGITAAVEPVIVSGMGAGADGRLYCGGLFDKAGPLAVSRLAAWDGTNWGSVLEGLGDGAMAPLSGQLRALAINGSDLYAGGMFQSVGNVQASRIARRNGTNWFAVGSGVKGTNDTTGATVSGLAVSGGNVYAAGSFTNAGGISANHIARWNGTTWFALGSGLNAGASAIAVSGSDVYVVGGFTNAGGAGASRVAQWNGSVWSPLSTGLNGTALAVAIGSDGIYAGGSFTMAGGGTANRVARWDGASWLPLGNGTTNGLDGTVQCILPISPTRIYVGGTFATAGNVPANRIAMFDGVNWTALGSGVSGGTSPGVNALAFDGVNVYVTGRFTNAGGLLASGMAKWDGTNWTVLGSGVLMRTVSAFTPGQGMAVALSGNDVYFGGSFILAGGKTSANIAHWNEQVSFTPVRALQLGRSQWSATGFQIRALATLGATTVIEASTDLVTWTPLATNSASPFLFNDPASLSVSNRLYRTRQLP